MPGMMAKASAPTRTFSAAGSPTGPKCVLDRLERQGLLRREPHPSDRRATQIVRTPEGLRYRDEVLQRLSEHSPLTSLADSRQDALRDLLRTLVAEH
ncbi:MarR family winged helix-turn-helix transcriptional regulator [Streptomyces niger]|uniref:MarR family winged helix-turn-helix transcriptional regulator n=1 Tax=Streptomyces niger TaxID=66373 RepID=UPI00069AE58A|nr:MarR family transcriptional regulator [Streptomyces niger]